VTFVEPGRIGRTGQALGPRTLVTGICHLGAAAYEPDLVNQPADMSYVLSRLLALDAQPGNVLSGLLNRDEIAAAGQSDGGDTVAALAASGCCADHRLKTVAVLSGAEWPAMPGLYFAHRAAA
jgi:predicted dienelactone hydrolase